MSVGNRIPDTTSSDDAAAIHRLRESFVAQRGAHARDPYPPLQQRVERMRTVAGMVLGHREAMIRALHADFGWHAEAIGDMIEILGVAARADYNIRHLAEWMRTEDREIDRVIFGAAQAHVRPQPKGVIGNMVPWNFPFDIAFGPLLDMLAAGNRVIIKPSDLGPACGELIARMVAESFDPEVVTVAVGGMELAKTFPTLRWDHLLYTGNPDVARSVMRAAAENLVPVTLELGGKCPTIVTADAVDERTVTTILGAKRMKSGQVCCAPDHLFVPHDQVAQFVALARQIYRSQTPEYSTSTDNTGMISQRHLQRLQKMVSEARVAGCEVIDLEDNPSAATRTKRQMPLYLVLEPTAELELSTQEIFGPVLPIIGYRDLSAVVAGINAGERPLALYVFTRDNAVAEDILARTVSGGACVNTAVVHGALPSLPFGGIGNSGMGRHHGIEGFREFSNPRSVLIRGDAADMFHAFNPPYTDLECIAAAAHGQMAKGASAAAVRPVG